MLKPRPFTLRDRGIRSDGGDENRSLLFELKGTRTKRSPNENHGHHTKQCDVIAYVIFHMPIVRIYLFDDLLDLFLILIFIDFL